MSDARPKHTLGVSINAGFHWDWKGVGISCCMHGTPTDPEPFTVAIYDEGEKGEADRPTHSLVIHAATAAELETIADMLSTVGEALYDWLGHEHGPGRP